ncbi:DUF3486 family protein [Methylobacillus flagellatus]|uniref:Uncharacterized protein n=1 Tax=Methylobacillus flagellatus (strain ATCC 51484 / DSM 6875 / VKM B-1610 / KT) TaxID=265072 RepID=Q1GXS2_METFK|nr:DUF3486 family protein [Methylobacillus flagellatus]ABE50965.1 hypothetical protein Mfla_2702 [Methylobacillus flagellatus KT]
MAKRSEVQGLPAEVRKWLDQTLAENNFSGYMEIAAALKERGYAISKSSVHRYGQKLENRLAAIKASTEAAEAIVNASPDEGDARSEAIMALVQTEMFDAILNLQEAVESEPEKRMKILASAAKSIALASRASVNQKKWAVEVRAKIAAKLNAASNEAESIAKDAGMSDDTWAAIRAKFLGIKVEV